MSDAISKAAEALRKDWELVPSISKAVAIFSALSVWFVLDSSATSKTKDTFVITVLTTNFLILVVLVIVRPFWITKFRYPFSGFMSGEFEIISDGGIWFLIDHRRKKIRWIANMTTAVELGLRHPDHPSNREKMKDKSMFEYLNSKN